MRGLRAGFVPELWRDLGEAASPATFALTEAAAAGVLVLVGVPAAVRDNRRPLLVGLGVAAGGATLVAAAAGLWSRATSPFGFMVLSGVRIYLPYPAVHTTLLERLVAMSRGRGTVGFLMYLADAVGYLGYAAVLVAGGLVRPSEDFLSFFLALSWAATAACLALIVPCGLYFTARPGASAAPGYKPTGGG